jgi:hypothetical protein
MGIDLHGLRALLDLYARYGEFGQTVQLGRQGLYISEHQHPEADSMLRRFGFEQTWGSIIGSDQFADEHLLPKLGANPIIAVDASSYEGAGIVHDFNNPIASEHHGCFDTLLEFGSLEHIFNLPVAIANMMRMLRVGGRLVSLCPANNWLGHGFYQIGPELPFRVYQPENGFRLASVTLTGQSAEPIELTDQGAHGIRNEIGGTASQNYVITIAEKISDTEPFRRWPQQGDYQHAWEIHQSVPPLVHS